MKKIGIFLILITVIVSSTAAQQNASSGITLNSAVDSACYAVGVNYGAGLREQMKTLPGAEGNANLNALAEGFVHSIKSELDALLMTAEEAQAYIQSYVMDATVKEAEAAKEVEVRFLAENKTQEGVFTTESGLQYKIITQGEGRIPETEDIVKVNYMGMLLDGTIFDSSEKYGEPLTIGLTDVFQGWAELLQLMPVGSKYVAWIPSELAYGSQGMGQIKPNSMLIFEVELLSIGE